MKQYRPIDRQQSIICETSSSPRSGRFSVRSLWMAIFAGTLLTGSAVASAATVTCSGTVVAVGYHADNTMMVQLSSMNTAVLFCNTDEDWSVAPGYVTSAATCKALYATFLAARLSGESVGMWLEGNSVPTTCDGWTQWQTANIRHFLL